MGGESIAGNGQGPQVKDLPKKLKRLLKLLELSEEDFYKDFCETQGVMDRRTPQNWLSEAEKEAHAPAKGNREKIVKYFGAKLDIVVFPMALLYCDLTDFDAMLAEAREKRSRSYLNIPLSHRLRRFGDKNITRLSGKYLLYRQTFRDTGSIVAEIFTLSQGDEPGQMNIKLYSYVMDSDEGPEVFAGHFFRYGSMFTAIVTFTNADKVDHMRVMHFPEVAYPEGLYGGLISGYSKSSGEAVAVRAVATRINGSAFDDKTDKERVKLISEDEPGLESIRTYLDNRLKPDQHVLSSDNTPDHLKKLARKEQ